MIEMGCNIGLHGIEFENLEKFKLNMKYLKRYLICIFSVAECTISEKMRIH